MPYPRGLVAAWPLLAVLLVAGAVGGGLLAYFLTRDDASRPTTWSRVIQRVTTQGRITTVEKPITVTTSAQPAEATPAPSCERSGTEQRRLHEDAGRRLRRSAAAARARGAEAPGTGSLDEAYADYNLAFTRFQLGSCDGVLELLDRSESIQGHREEIDRLRQQATGREK